MDTEYIHKGECVTFKSIAINVVLSLVKIISGYLGHSTAIMADGFHSASDLLSDFGILATLRLSRQPPDDRHHYGHRKVESMTAFLLGLTLSLIGLSFAYKGITGVFQVYTGEVIREIHPMVVVGAVLTVVAKEWIYRATKAIGRELNNDSIVANAWHHRSDALSSACTAIGVGLAIWGGSSWLIFDPLMAVFVAFFILKTALAIIRYNGSILLDTGADHQLTRSIRQLVISMEGVRDVHGIRSRYHGKELFVDLHVVVNSSWTVQQSHELCDELEVKLKNEIRAIVDVVVHIEPYDFS